MKIYMVSLLHRATINKLYYYYYYYYYTTTRKKDRNYRAKI